LVEAEQQGIENLGPNAIATPTVEAVIDGLPGTIAFGKIAPGSTGVEMPKNAVDHSAVGPPGMARVVGMVLGEEGGDQFPLSIGEFVAVHVELLPGSFKCSGIRDTGIVRSKS
jgi:hypothetical protein